MELVRLILLLRVHSHDRGLGDYFPTTDASRLFTAIYVLVGAGYLSRSQQMLRRISALETKSEKKDN